MPSVLSSVIAIAVGISIIVGRRRVLQTIIQRQRSLSARLSTASEKYAKPSAMLFPGIVAIFLGALFIAASIFL